MQHFKAQGDVSQIFQEKQPFGKDSKIWLSFYLSILYNVPVYLNCLDFLICMTLTALTLIGEITSLSIINCWTFRNAVKRQLRKYCKYTLMKLHMVNSPFLHLEHFNSLKTINFFLI